MVLEPVTVFSAELPFDIGIEQFFFDCLSQLRVLSVCADLSRDFRALSLRQLIKQVSNDVLVFRNQWSCLKILESFANANGPAGPCGAAGRAEGSSEAYVTYSANHFLSHQLFSQQCSTQALSFCRTLNARSRRAFSLSPSFRARLLRSAMVPP